MRTYYLINAVEWTLLILQLLYLLFFISLSFPSRHSQFSHLFSLCLLFLYFSLLIIVSHFFSSFLSAPFHQTFSLASSRYSLFHTNLSSSSFLLCLYFSFVFTFLPLHLFLIFPSSCVCIFLRFPYYPPHLSLPLPFRFLPTSPLPFTSSAFFLSPSPLITLLSS